MADAAVGLVIDKLIQLLKEEANLLRGIRKEVDGINHELQSIHAFLKDADSRAEAEKNDHHSVKLWVDELREVAEKIEDLIDEYIQDIAERRDKQQDQRTLRRRIVCFFRKVSCFVAKLKPHHEIASKIKEIKQEIEGISRRRNAYNFNSIQQGSSSTNPPNRSWFDPRDGSIFIKEDEVVGIQSDKKELVGRLLENEFQQHDVLALVGMGGIGKTTLANQVFEEVKEKFDCHAWIDVSQSYNKVDLLRSLVKKFFQSRKEFVPQGIDQEMDQHELMRILRHYLQGKSYVVTFDDVWDENFWAYVKNCLPNESGSRGRVVITTRNVEVANCCKMSSSVHIHQTKLLSSEDSWELFCTKAFFSENEKVCPNHLVGLSLEIVERCHGLPLAVVVIGSLLATKQKNVNEWRNLLTALSSELVSNKYLESIHKILSLSYTDLPYYLKSCFLYFGIFPEDFSIRSRRLVRQWIAEGFVKPQKEKTLEVIAEEYLAELVSRSMVQVSHRDVKGRVRSCRIHDLVREFILTIQEDLRFCEVVSQNCSNDFKRLIARRISFFPGSREASSIGDIPKSTRIRSVFAFDKEENCKLLLNTITSNLKLIKVIDFEDCQSLDLLPNDIGNLFHLKYLSLRGTKVEVLPKSIGKLQNLETLDLKHSLIYELPAEINKLCKLRYLIAYHENDPNHYSIKGRRGVRICKGFGSLKLLEKLYKIEANVEGVNVFEELRKLTELRKLVISKLTSENGTKLFGCIQELKRLESLEVLSIDKDEVIDSESISSPPQSLRILSLHGHLRIFPEWITRLENLVRISMTWSNLEDDLLKSLCHLPNLLEVRIGLDAYYGEKLQFEKGAFPKLKKLELWMLSRLNSVIIEEGALPNLEELYIGPCPMLKEMPSGLHHLSTLNILLFLDMPTQLLLFQNFQSIQYVPKFYYYCTAFGGKKFVDLNQVHDIQKFVKEHGEIEWNSLSYEEIIRKALLME